MDIQKPKNKFINAILHASSLAIIGELKLASPTNPYLGDKEDIRRKISEYSCCGISAVSIITEKHFFKGDIGCIALVKQHTKLPILQKDFVIDESQVYQAKCLGVDALLLIARILTTKKLAEFVELTQKLGIEPVVEIASDEDLKKALKTTTRIIAANARNLNTLEVDVEKACQLLKKLPKHLVPLGFSGVNSSKEIAQYKNAGARGVLIGTSLMQASNTKEFIRSLGI